ncbi:hypothetical protein FHX78_113973 [Streptomyces capillispiralis]|uniref:Uncharacterized protein n=1 Tax=Streptomyces capillispiralis TaxID=68182 RepID=A0A561TIR7_9ACTN|nr:hypothetical protein FHX78_113973 [Streptomyces capillispiralis]
MSGTRTAPSLTWDGAVRNNRANDQLVPNAITRYSLSEVE